MPLLLTRIRLAACGLVLTVFAIAACSDGDDAARAPSADATITPAVAATHAEAIRPPGASRALKISTQTTVAATDVVAALDALRAAVADTGGYVSDAKITAKGESEGAELEARIPAAELPRFRTGMGALGSVLSDTEKAEDVTEQRADLDARLRNAAAQEKRLLALLSDRTGSLSDVIAAEKALGESRDLVERLQAEQQTLAGQIAYATVRVRIVRRQEPAPETARAMIAAAASKGVVIARRVAVSGAVILVTVGPTLAMLLAVGALVFLIARPIQRRLASARPIGRPV